MFGDLHVGDCAEIMPAYAGQADLILTSPPYDNLRNYGDDGFDFDRVADACVGALKPGGVLVWVVADATIDGSETGNSFRQALGFMDRGLRLYQTLIYSKDSGGPAGGWPKVIRHLKRHEYMYVFSSGQPNTVNVIKDRRNRLYEREKGQSKEATVRQPDGSMRASVVHPPEEYGRRTTIWHYKVGFRKQHPGFPAAHEHPATMPYALAADHVRTWTNPGDLVIDPMAGSGTTLRAAKDLGRQWVGIEIHEAYADIIRRRMAQDVLPLFGEDEMPKNDQTARAKFLVEHQLKGGSRDEAIEIWEGAEEIAASFENDGIRTTERLTDGEIQQAVDIYRAIRRAGL